MGRTKIEASIPRVHLPEDSSQSPMVNARSVVRLVETYIILVRS